VNRQPFTAFLLAALCFPVLAHSAGPGILPQDLTVRVWGKSDGLPDNAVNSVLQTKDGYLWVGTAAGLARFDGARFVVVKLSPTNGSARVTALCEDSAERLWIGTQNDGLFWHADGVTHRFSGRRGSLEETINSIAEDSSRVLWIGTPAGLYRLEETKLQRMTSADGLPNDFVSSVHVARSGTVWITTRGGMCQYKNGKVSPFEFQTESPGRSPESLGVYEDRQGNLWAFGDTYLVNLGEGKRFNYFHSGDTSSVRIWSLCEGRNGQLWIGTSGQGLYCFADDKFLPLALRGQLTSDVRALCEDREGNLWLGTYGGGLVRLQTSRVRVLDAGLGLPDSPCVCLAFNGRGNSWVGFEHGGVYAGNANRFERSAGETGLNMLNPVSSICVGADSDLWLGTPGAGLYRVREQRALHYTTANGLSDNAILAMAVEPDGTVWVSTLAGGLHCFSGENLSSFGRSAGLSGQPITAIVPARAGGLWMGTEAGEVFRGIQRQFHEPSGKAERTAIRAMHEDGAGRLWLGMEGGQLGCLTDDRYQSWELGPPGAAGDSVLGILSDDGGNLWLGMNRAIYRLGRKELLGLVADQAPLRAQLIVEAAPSANSAPIYGWPRAARAPDGKLWFGTVSGVVAIDPHGGPTEAVAPPVLIEAVVADGLRLALPSFRNGTAAETAAPMRLSPDLRLLEIQFTALSFTAPEKLRFRYRLEGFDPDWAKAGPERSVRYGRLPYGSYTFHVQAVSSEGSWAERDASFPFLIPPPVWRSKAALAGYALVVVGLVGGTVRLVSYRRLRRRLAALAAQQAMERERMRIAQDMHDEIGSKLTKISFMSERAKGDLQGQEPVALKLDAIAQTSRDLLQSLDEIVWVVDPHNDTLEHLAAYLSHYATEYLQNTAVECELRIPPGLPNLPLSAEARHNLFLAFEEALNNALKHGRPSRVQVEMRVEAARFEIKIQDDGCGFDADAVKSGNGEGKAKKRGGNGLPNMQQRLAEVGGLCAIRSRAGTGTCVSLTVPLQAERFSN
jgi:ligand-binding sensor domain-containing protein/signal transduction histidine kinase